MSSFLDRSKSLARKSNPASSTPTAAHHSHHKPEGGRPSDHLINRGEQWRLNVKAVHDFYATIAASERHAATELEKAASALPLPFVHGAQFNQEEGGWQHTLLGVRDQARKIAEIHDRFAKEIEGQVLADLTRTKHSIKQHTKEIAADAGKLADETDNERKLSTTALSKHGAAISTAGRGLAQPVATDDPYISANVVDRQLAQQVESENRLTRALIHHQSISEEREKRSTVEIQTAAKAFTAAHDRAFESLKTEWATLDRSLQAIDPAGEWASFKGLKGAFVDPETKLRDPSLIAYPHQGHESAEAKWTGTLERKKRFAKSYVEVKVVVTASGFLHTFPLKSDGDDPKKALPDLSLYLPSFSLGPQPSESSSKHKIYIEGRKAVKSGAESMMKKVGLGKREIDYTFRAPTHAEIIKVWGIIEPYTREVINVTPAQTKKSQVPAVVAAVGLPEGKEAAQAQEAAADDAITHEHVADAEAESGPIQHETAAVEDEDERGGSSDEEEVYNEASATTPAVEKGKAAEGEALPGYAPGQLAAPLGDKKAHFAEPDASSSASSGGPHVGGSAAAIPGQSSHSS